MKTFEVVTAIDHETGTSFDDWVPYEDADLDVTPDANTFAPVCDSCIDEHGLFNVGDGVAPGTLCGVEGCSDEADHYYDFTRKGGK